MDASTPPVIIEIVTTKRHDIKAEIVEKVARLLAEADGKNPDQDIRCSVVGSSAYYINCNPLGMTNPAAWGGYTEQAEKILRKLFHD